MGVKAHQNVADSSKSEIGEIDTRAPFESVKAAVSLFGVAAFSSDKPVARKLKPLSAENILAKETQLHVAQKELDRLREQLNNAEATRTQALAELEEAKRTVEVLTGKLKIVNESKESAVKAAESAKTQIGNSKEVNSEANSENGLNWTLELDKSREQCSIVIAELDGTKQELRRTRRDFEASMEAKASASRQEEEAEKLTIAHRERAAQLAKETEAVQESLVLLKHAILQAKQEESKILSEKELSRHDHKLALEAVEKQAASLREELDPEILGDLRANLAEVEAEVGSVQKELGDLKQADMDSSSSMVAELDAARETLHKVAEEAASLRTSAELLKLELEKVRKELADLREKEAQTESLVVDLHRKLREGKAELQLAGARESKAVSAREELISARQQLVLEAENARREAEEMKKTSLELRKEAEAAGLALEEAETKLRAALREASEAKVAETAALGEMKLLSDKTNAARASTSESGAAAITISDEEHKSLSQVVEESEALAEMKVAAAAAQVEAVRASENEAVKRLEALQQELVEVKSATEDAIKRAEMADAARRAVEAEMKRWREREQKKVAEEAASSQVSKMAAPPQLGSLVDGNSPSHLSGEQPAR
ncbi:unnamed protein product [Spirodela intermedia]|uniref:Uncharacterized protein n=1 Tax=Spirodela intermedia TaxID=51605 RepID=A0A7I8LIL8_SPIIN|nr:unnamed protein product [Spirodela intermedia]